MKLLYLANLRLPTEKAYGIQIAKMCEAFAAYATINSQPPTTSYQKIEVELVVPYRISKISDDFFEYYGVERNFKFKKIWTLDFYLPGKLDRISFYIKNLISALVLTVYALRQELDVIYSRDELVIFLLCFFKKNIVFEAHRFSRYKTFFYWCFKSRNIKIIVITQALKKEFTKIGFSDDSILVAPDGVDIEKFDLSISKEGARERAGLPLDKKIVMYTGHLFQWKGADVLLEVARSYQLSVPIKDRGYSTGVGTISYQPMFVFVGGTDYDLEKFRKKAKGLNNVLILGHKSHKDIPVYLKAADVLVLPNSAKEEISRYHTSPLKLFEYMASGRPIVASALPSIAEILNDRNSILVKSDDVNDLTEGVKKALNNNLLSEELAKKAKDDVKKYNWGNRVLNILSFI